MHSKIEQHHLDNFDRLVIVFSHRAGGRWNSEDVVQEAFTRALKYSNSFDEDKQEFGGWFNGILNNALRDYTKDVRLLGMSVEYTEDMDELIPLLEWESDLIDAVKKDIERKSEGIRQALWLYLFRQYKPREIAQVVDMTNAHIRTAVKEFKQENQKKYGAIL